jgi:hypothetical protein
MRRPGAPAVSAACGRTARGGRSRWRRARSPGVQHPVCLDGLGATVVEVGGRVERDAGVAVLVVVPSEEPAAEREGVPTSLTFGLSAPVRIRATAGGTPRVSSPSVAPVLGHAGLTWETRMESWDYRPSRQRVGTQWVQGAGGTDGPSAARRDRPAARHDPAGSRTRLVRGRVAAYVREPGRDRRGRDGRGNHGAQRRIKAPEQEHRELRRANAILKSASAFMWTPRLCGTGRRGRALALVTYGGAG